MGADSLMKTVRTADVLLCVLMGAVSVVKTVRTAGSGLDWRDCGHTNWFTLYAS